MSEFDPKQDLRLRGSSIDELLRQPMSRKQALQRVGIAGLAVTSISAIVAACGGTNANSSAESAAATSTQLVMTSGATAVTLDPMVSLDGQSPLLWRVSLESLRQITDPALKENHETRFRRL